MNATQRLHNLGQSLWLDNITRARLNSGTHKRYIEELSVTGLTSNPTTFDHAFKNCAAYDAAIREGLAKGKCGEGLVSIWHWTLSPAPRTCSGQFTTARKVRTDGCRWRCRHGWRMTRRAPSRTPRNIPHGRDGTTRSSKFRAPRNVYRRSRRRFLQVCRFNVTLLNSREQYVAASEAYLRGIERRIAARL